MRATAARLPSLQGAAFVRMDECTPLERKVLHERHLVSRELVGLDRGGEGPAGAGVLVTGDAGVMVNEEDHLRVQVFRSGFDVLGALRQASVLDAELGAALPYASHPEFGFLTACPTNTGTGLRASVPSRSNSESSWPLYSTVRLGKSSSPARSASVSPRPLVGADCRCGCRPHCRVSAGSRRA